MQGLFKVALFLGLTLVSALVQPAEDGDKTKSKLAGYPLALISVEIPSIDSSPDESVALPFKIEVLPSEQLCGYGNVTINGQELTQEAEGDADTITVGSGLIKGPGAAVDAIWRFECISVSGHPKLQLLKFMINAVDGTPLEHAEQLGFTLLFAQTGAAQILRVNTDLTAPDNVPFPATLAPINADDYSRARMEEELADLDWMISQVKELEYLIAEKQAAIARYTPNDFGRRVGHCDSLKCAFQGLRRKIGCAARKIYSKVQGGHHDEDDEGSEEWKSHKKHHCFKNPFHHGKGKHGNHNCDDHKHEKGNHTHPHPCWLHCRRPHRPLPICRFPPPHHPPHGRPPHRKPHDGPHGPPEHHKPPRPGRPGHKLPDDQEAIIPRPVQDFVQGDGPYDGHPPPPHAGHHGGPRHGRPRFIIALRFLEFFAMGIILCGLLSAIFRRACSPSRRADRRARREERRRRRSYNRARRHQAFRRFLARVTGRSFGEDRDDHEEKRAALLADAEDGLSVTMSDEITQFRNAAGVVEEIITAEVKQARFSPREDKRSMTAQEIGSQVGESEPLLANVDNDGSEMSSIADGLRYTPSSTNYDSSQSREGTLSDIVEPATKDGGLGVLDERDGLCNF